MCFLHVQSARNELNTCRPKVVYVCSDKSTCEVYGVTTTTVVTSIDHARLVPGTPIDTGYEIPYDNGPHGWRLE